MLKRKIIVSIAACSIMLAGCVSEQTYVGSEKPVANRTFDNIEAARTRISLGLNYLRRGDNSEAKYNLERARSFAPNSAEVYSALAYYYENVSEADQAEEYYLIAIDKDPNYADAYNNYGAFLCQLHKYEEAERLLLKAINRPGYIRVAESYENLAMCQLQQNNFQKTKTYLDNSINHNSTRISSLVLASGLSYAMGEMTEAKNQLARIQRLGRVSARTVLLSYLIADKSGDITTKNNAEQLLLTLYMGSAETTLLLQDKLTLTEFELLRERYKETLMSNITLPTETATSVAIAKPVANPKLKIVKRKSASTDAAKPTEATVAITPVAGTLPVLKNVTSAIANSLVTNSNKTVAEVDITKPQALLAKNDSLVATTIGAEHTVERVAIADTNDVQSKVAPDADATTAEDRELSFHLVQADDSLYAISMKYNIRLQRLMEWNQLTPESAILTGQKIWLQQVPEQQLNSSVKNNTNSQIGSRIQVTTTEPYHQVAAGETMFAISYRYNIKLDKFMAWNDLTEQSKLYVGQQILVMDPALIEP